MATNVANMSPWSMIIIYEEYWSESVAAGRGGGSEIGQEFDSLESQID